ncbi:MAG: glycosyltransferase family 87 protein, partial [Ktedonobacterales bacterium]
MYNYPPLLAILLEPLSVLPCGWANVLWQSFSIASWLWSITWLTWDVYQHSGARRAVAVAAVMTFYLPIVNGFYEGQVHLILLAIFVTSFMLVERGHPYAAGAVLAFGVYLKYLPIVIIGYYVLRGQWRVALGASIGGAALGVFELLVGGPQLVIQSVLAIPPSLAVGTNLTLAAIVPLAAPIG